MRLTEVAGTQPAFIIYVDMDGVVANFVKGVSKIFPNYSEEKYRSDPKYRSKMWRTVIDYGKKGGELWYELPEMEDARTLMNFLKDYPHEILSATGKTSADDTAKQKRRWVKDKLGSLKVNLVRAAGDKAQYATPNAILIDDQPKAIDPFKKAGGIGILHKSAAKTIEQLKKIIQDFENNEDQ